MATVHALVFCLLCFCCCIRADVCIDQKSVLICRASADGGLPLVTRTATKNTALYVMQDDRLTKLNVDRLRSRNITTVYLDHNRIEVIERGAFRRVRNVTVLSVTNNLLTTVDPIAFAPLRKLEILDLSHNPIHTVLPTFKFLKRLAWLGVTDTDLVSLDFIAALVAARNKTAYKLTVDVSNNRLVTRLDEKTVGAAVLLKSVQLQNNSAMRCKCKSYNVWRGCNTVDRDWFDFLQTCYGYAVTGGSDRYGASVLTTVEEEEVDDDDTSAHPRRSVRRGGPHEDEDYSYDDDDDTSSTTRRPDTNRKRTRVSVVKSGGQEDGGGDSSTTTMVYYLLGGGGVAAVMLATVFALVLMTVRRTRIRAPEQRRDCEYSGSNLSGYERPTVVLRSPQEAVSNYTYESSRYPDVELPTFDDYMRRQNAYDTPKFPVRALAKRTSAEEKALLQHRPLPTVPEPYVGVYDVPRTPETIYALMMKKNNNAPEAALRQQHQEDEEKAAEEKEEEVTYLTMDDVEAITVHHQSSI